jgi:hypothetical protein
VIVVITFNTPASLAVGKLRVQFPRIASSNGGMKLILTASRFSVFLFMFVIVESSSQQLCPIPPEEV